MCFEQGAPNLTIVKKFGRDTTWFNPEFIEAIAPDIFNVEQHRRAGSLTGSATGRAKAYFLQIKEHALVLRQFRRGGLIGRLNPEWYLDLGPERSRPHQEYKLLEWMTHKGLAVPTPVAARHAPWGFWYRGDLITKRILDARTLAEIITEYSLEPRMWQKVGEAIRQMHDLSVYHSDLNCRNILLDRQDKVWLIDFDKCGRKTGENWKLKNLNRLKRSLIKLTVEEQRSCWTETDWSALLTGYDRNYDKAPQ